MIDEHSHKKKKIEFRFKLNCVNVAPNVNPSFVQCPDGDKKCHLWTAVDLAFFVLMGLVGGLLGAMFNCINKRFAKYRMRNVHPKAKFFRYMF